MTSTSTTPAWETYAARYQQLANTPLDPATVDQWLAQWSDLSKEVGEAYAVAFRDKDEDTTDEAAQERYLSFVRDILPRSQQADQALKEKLLALQGWQPAEQHQQMLRRLRAEAALYREDNVQLEADIAAKANQYRQITGRMTVTLGGEELTFAQASLRLQDPDRAKREEAWRSMADRRLADREQLDALYLELLAMRRQVAR
ncbi:MAG TPA: oligoendopeptidase F, partial [Deinococcales bacterium]|nr:oligoendopeptidase F [Deinococcales bacterium]